MIGHFHFYVVLNVHMHICSLPYLKNKIEKGACVTSLNREGFEENPEVWLFCFTLDKPCIKFDLDFFPKNGSVTTSYKNNTKVKIALFCPLPCIFLNIAIVFPNSVFSLLKEEFLFFLL